MLSRKDRKYVICQILSLLIQSEVRSNYFFVNFTIDFCKWVTPPGSFLTTSAFVHKMEHNCEIFQVSQLCSVFLYINFCSDCYNLFFQLHSYAFSFSCHS